MAISYPLTMPNNPGIRSAEIYVAHEQQQQRSVNNTAFIQEQPGARWIGKIDLPILSLDQAAEWAGFFDALHGMLGSFVMPHPDFTEPRGTASGTGAVNGAGQTGTTLAVDGLNFGTLKRGDVIQVGPDTAPHWKRVTKDVSLLGGAGTIDIWPPLHSSPADNTAVKLSNPLCKFRLADGFVAPRSDEMRQFHMSFAIEEVLE